jgi:phosphate-selective porin OprO/OprP
VQSEYLDAKVKLENKPAYEAHGWYAFGSWVATGESRSYSGGNVSDVLPKGPWGALEFLVRYSTLNLDDGPTLGGTEHDWTFGTNWYLTKYLKLQGNYVRAISDRRDVRVDPRIFEVRAQIMF